MLVILGLILFLFMRPEILVLGLIVGALDLCCHLYRRFSRKVSQ